MPGKNSLPPAETEATAVAVTPVSFIVIRLPFREDISAFPANALLSRKKKAAATAKKKRNLLR